MANAVAAQFGNLFENYKPHLKMYARFRYANVHDENHSLGLVLNLIMSRVQLSTRAYKAEAMDPMCDGPIAFRISSVSRANVQHSNVIVAVGLDDVRLVFTSQ